MVQFTIPEINIICIFAGDSKAETIANIMDGIPHFSHDKNMIDIAEQSIIKLDTLTETEYENMNFNENFTI